VTIPWFQFRFALRRRRMRRLGFTLVELLVALALSILVLQAIVPALGRLRSAQRADQAPQEQLAGWETVLRADLANLVSPVKSGVKVVQIRRSGPEQAFDQLELQSFVRPGDGGNGPVSVRYAMEATDDGHSLTLIRYSRGWHDNLETKHILLNGLSGWELLNAPQRIEASTTQPATMPTAAPSGAMLVVVMQRGVERRFGYFWSTSAIGEVRDSEQSSDRTTETQ